MISLPERLRELEEALFSPPLSDIGKQYRDILREAADALEASCPRCGLELGSEMARLWREHNDQSLNHPRAQNFGPAVLDAIGPSNWPRRVIASGEVRCKTHPESADRAESLRSDGQVGAQSPSLPPGPAVPPSPALTDTVTRVCARLRTNQAAITGALLAKMRHSELDDPVAFAAMIVGLKAAAQEAAVLLDRLARRLAELEGRKT